MRANVKRHRLAAGGAQVIDQLNGTINHANSQAHGRTQAYRLFCGRSKNPIVEIVPDGQPGLYRVAWPDIGLSEATNLSRAMEAAQNWAEQFFTTKHRKISVARRLKSLNNFSWSASPIRQNELAGHTFEPIGEAALRVLGRLSCSRRGRA
jgi:hypothetical protein